MIVLMQFRCYVSCFVLLFFNWTESTAPGNHSNIQPSATEKKSKSDDVSRPKEDKSSLIQAHMQFRTGLYTPNSLSENDAEIYPGFLKPFPELPNLVLTNEGKSQMFKLGLFFQWWYGSVMNYTYDPLQYRIVSSTCVWNIESANAVWAGMFPLDTNDTQKLWNPNLNIWPIPVHLEHKVARRGPTVLLEGTDPPCPRIRNLIMSSTEYDTFIDDWEWLWDYLCDKAKTPGDADFMEALNVAAALMVVGCYEEKMPSWANTTTVHDSTNMYFAYLKMLAGFYDVLRISTGWWWELVLLEFNRAIHEESQRKIVQYASHNDMLVACISSVTDTPDMWPDWGAGFSVELHHREGINEVEIWSWLNPNQPEPTFLNITDCPTPCSLEDFSRIVSKYAVADARFECGTVQPATGSYFPRAMLGLFIGTMLFCLFSLFLCLREFGNYKKAYNRYR